MLDIGKFDEHVCAIFPEDGFYFAEWQRIKTALVELDTAPNTPSKKCYSIDCPAIWFDKCTSTKYSECCVLRESE